MAFQVEITSIAEAQIEQAYRWYRERNSEFADRWFRGLMNAIATLQEKPHRCALAIEHDKYLSKFICIFFAEVLNNYFGV
jgi:plasmid stabilization system protein ParE